MSFHTKYRPQTFDDVMGQAPVIKSLKKVVKDGRAHAFILSGPSGTGKTTLARILASELCGAALSITNIEEVDAASHSGADDARALVSRSLFRAIGGSPNRFFIVDEAHRMSSAAWTCFLKPVEEPPAHVYYTFCTTDPNKIPKAIQTRCLRYDLKPVSEDEIIQLLDKVIAAEKLEIDDDLIEAIVENSNGSPRQALVYLEECVGLTLSEARALMRSAGQTKELIDLARWLVSGKGLSWAEATKYLKALDGQEAESCRIVLTNYFASVLINQKNDKAAKNLLQLIDAFSKPYNPSDKMAPLYLSVGLALGLDQ